MDRDEKKESASVRRLPPPGTSPYGAVTRATGAAKSRCLPCFRLYLQKLSACSWKSSSTRWPVGCTGRDWLTSKVPDIFALLITKDLICSGAFWWQSIIVTRGAHSARILHVTFPHTVSILPLVLLLPSFQSSSQMVSCCPGISEEPYVWPSLL